jgi:hypothetical protein
VLNRLWFTDSGQNQVGYVPFSVLPFGGMR